MLHLVMAACLQYVVEAYEIAFDVGVGIRNRVAHPCLRREIHHHSNAVFGENVLHCLLVGNGILHKRPVAPKSLNLLQSLILDIDIIIIRNAVNTNHFDALNVLKKTLHKVAADESCCTGHQHRLVLK